MSSGMRSILALTATILATCWVSHGAELRKVTAPGQHYYTRVGVVDQMSILTEQDRAALKTIVVNEALTYENLLMPLVSQTYRESGMEGGDCALALYHSGKHEIRKVMTELNNLIDTKMNHFSKEWAKRVEWIEPDDLYIRTFWIDRDQLYQHVTNNQQGICRRSLSVKCTGIDLLENAYAQIMIAMGDCKVKYWKGPSKI